MTEQVKDVIGLVFRLVLAGVIGYAGLIKVFEPDGAKGISATGAAAMIEALH